MSHQHDYLNMTYTPYEMTPTDMPKLRWESPQVPNPTQRTIGNYGIGEIFSSVKSTQTGYPVQNDQSRNIHIGNIIKSEQVTFRNICVYAYIHVIIASEKSWPKFEEE